MKIRHENLRKGEVKVNIENLDDLWYLSTIADPGDLIRGETYRKIKIGADIDKSGKVVKKRFFLR